MLAASVRSLAADGAVTRADGIAYLEREHGLTGLHARRAWRAARIRAHLLHHHETALWRARPEGRFVALEEPEPHDPTEARAEMFRRYLAAFGPASRRDMVAWSMMHVPEIQRALDRLEPLRRFRDEQGHELLDVPRAPLPDRDTPAPVRFLPKWDNVLLAFHDRTRVLPEPYRRKVIGMNGDVAQTYLVDGFVAGTWRVENGRVAIEPLASLSRSTRREVVDEAERLEAFLARPAGLRTCCAFSRCRLRSPRSTPTTQPCDRCRHHSSATSKDGSGSPAAPSRSPICVSCP
jgi:hypothetical protein